MTSTRESPPSGPPAATFRVEGFSDPRLNQQFAVNHHIRIGGQPTYWDSTGSCFMYFQHVSECRCWAICPAFDEGRNLLHDVQVGNLRGLAFEMYDEGFAVWCEYSESEDAWSKRRVIVTPVPAPGMDVPAFSPSAASAQAHLSEAKQAVRSSLPNKLLQDNPHVEEIVLVKGQRSVKVLVRFNSARNAADAVEVGRQLLRGGKIDRVQATPMAQFSNFRQESQQRRRATQTQAVEPPKKRQR